MTKHWSESWDNRVVGYSAEYADHPVKMAADGELAKLALQLLEPIKDRRRGDLRILASVLKQSHKLLEEPNEDHWSVGEMLERACIALDAIETGGGMLIRCPRCGSLGINPKE